MSFAESQEKEDGKVKKRSLLLIAVLVVALLTALSVPAYATKPYIDLGGEWDYQGEPFFDEKWADGNYFLSFADCGTWTGGFEGTVCDAGDMVFHSSGSVFAKYTVWFSGEVWDESTGTCLGEGTLEIRFVGKGLDEEVGMQGTWVILDGTGDLATLHGHGTWWGWGSDSVPGTPDLYYSGQVHQAPD
ncbi:MAG: hypothetical protein JXA74_05095 [Anaerolineae bacterium]|nr:hypothetical protein [Anaerolineae bacterium]